MLGVIGGMGPLATADFFRKLVDATPAASDDAHVPVLIHSVPQIPSRPAAILRNGTSPLPHLMAARDRLLAMGATALAMPCNTAHHWYDDLVAGCPAPFIHIADAAADRLPADVTTIGMLATCATLEAQVYQRRLGARRLNVIVPERSDVDGELQRAIDEVKRGEVAAAGHRIEPLVERLQQRGAQMIVLACTELPPALDAIGSPLRADCLDATDALARACVDWWRSCSKAPNL